MTQNQIQWFPGHMAKTRRQMKECLPLVDIVLELVDARIPYSSRNPEISELCGEKPRVTVFTKCTLADPNLTKKWRDVYTERGEACALIDSLTGMGLDTLRRTVLAEKIERYRQKGMKNRTLRAMIVGIPNVGKSSLINKLAGGKKAKVENRPGVTLSKQWVPTGIGLDLLDMPGVLWPKFEDSTVGENLAITGAIKDAILDKEEIAMILCSRLMSSARSAFLARYKLDEEECLQLDSYDLFELVGKKRGLLMSGGAINHERCADMLLEEFRCGKIGRITLDVPR